MASVESDTTVRVTRPVKKQLDRLKPYDSMSYDEFLSELADHYEADA